MSTRETHAARGCAWTIIYVLVVRTSASVSVDLSVSVWCEYECECICKCECDFERDGKFKCNVENEISKERRVYAGLVNCHESHECV